MIRRDFLKYAIATTAGFAGLQRWSARPVLAGGQYGALVRDERLLDLPAGFSYQVISRTGERMSDGFLVPGAHDGMAAFPGPQGRTLIVRNHELSAGDLNTGPFGAGNTLASKLQSASFYDAGIPGGTTTLIYDTKNQRLDQHYLSLVGTVRNCSGGPTPWNTWISCEETVQKADGAHHRDHGYNFEVPAAGPLAEPVPLKEMGRFNHEAVAIDPETGIVYQTEDRDNGLIYRFIPNRRGSLRLGGRLEALKVRDFAGVNTSNRPNARFRTGQRLEVEWVPLRDVESPRDDLRLQGHTLGAATFDRGEGMWHGRDGIYFACTAGGPAQVGQVWRYVPSRREGTREEQGSPGTLELFIEPNNASILENIDNLTIAPWGDIFLCEDGPDVNRVVGITPGGQPFEFARNVLNDSELAGAAFSPDGTTMFVNIQDPGITLAITGPWRRNQS
jgi:secreted PhoX family phosphatase